MKTAIEFWGKIEDGVIKLPLKYLDTYSGLNARIVVTLDGVTDGLNQKSQLRDLFSQAQQHNIFSTISAPVDWQKDLRNEWD